jgi:histidinol-phosphate/aromatic aminotransferase/cobyric acid decarboxylase-like protein
MLVIDEAYGEFADGLDDPVFDLVERGDTVILRTFSKAYGCAGSRVGWGVFPPAIATEMRKILNPNNVSGVSQAMATAVMRDQGYMHETVRETARIRDDFIARMRAIGLVVPDSHTNFALLAFPSAQRAAAADAALRADGIAMRGMGGYALPHCLRATIADERAMDRAAPSLERFMGDHA